MVYLWYVLSILELLFSLYGKMYLAMHLLDIKTSKNNFWSWYSGSQSHTTRRGRASCSLWYAPVANVCDLLLFLDENRVIPDFRHFWKVTSPDEELFTVLYFPFDAFPMTWPRKLFTGLNSTGMMVTWLRTLIGQYLAINEISRARQATFMIALSFGTCSEIDPSINLISSNYEHYAYRAYTTVSQRIRHCERKYINGAICRPANGCDVTMWVWKVIGR